MHFRNELNCVIFYTVHINHIFYRGSQTNSKILLSPIRGYCLKFFTTSFWNWMEFSSSRTRCVEGQGLTRGLTGPIKNNKRIGTYLLANFKGSGTADKIWTVAESRISYKYAAWAHAGLTSSIQKWNLTYPA